ncbi:MAG TPA: methyltransferase [Chloroflexota bacterium]|nr:methyltransferase [Chloroflexota bacterium]
MSTALLLLAGQWLFGLWMSVVGRRDFVHPDERNLRLNAVIVIGLFTGLAHSYEVISRADTFGSFAILSSLVLLVCASLLFGKSVAVARRCRFYTVFSGKTPDFLAQNGPYAYIRHPIYTAYILFWSSLFVLSGSIVVGEGAFILTVFYLVAARVEEREWQAAAPASYAAYKQTTGMFFPKVRRRPAG